MDTNKPMLTSTTILTKVYTGDSFSCNSINNAALNQLEAPANQKTYLILSTPDEQTTGRKCHKIFKKKMSV